MHKDNPGFHYRCILDRRPLVKITWDLPAGMRLMISVCITVNLPFTVLYFLGYNACSVGYYFLQPLVLIFSSSMVINLSNLTANVYSLIFAVFLFGNKVGLHKIQCSAFQLLQVKHCCMFAQQTKQKGLVQPKSSV